MTTEPNEKDLQELFDDTAATADAPVLERLEARARATVRSPHGKARQLWVPAALAVAAGAALLWRASTPDPPERFEATEHAVAVPGPSSARAPLATLELATTAVDAETESTDEDVADVFDDLALDPGDLSDAELDAWTASAGSTLDG